MLLSDPSNQGLGTHSTDWEDPFVLLTGLRPQHRACCTDLPALVHVGQGSALGALPKCPFVLTQGLTVWLHTDLPQTQVCTHTCLRTQHTPPLSQRGLLSTQNVHTQLPAYTHKHLLLSPTAQPCTCPAPLTPHTTAHTRTAPCDVPTSPQDTCTPSTQLVHTHRAPSW